MAARLCLSIGFAALSLSLAAASLGEEILPPDYAPAELPAAVNPPHLVLEAPRPLKHRHHATGETVVYDDGWEAIPAQNSAGPSAEAFASESNHEHVKLHQKLHDKVAPHFLHADKTPRSIAIPDANRVPVWKTPYSYGHFGASRNRQWSFHNGHQQRYSQWTLR